MNLPRFYIPDKAFFGLSLVAILISWGLSLWAWPDLPARIPSHFGPTGYPDAWSAKSFWSVFLIPTLQVGLSGLLWWSYKHPQYSNIPSTMTISALPEPVRLAMFKLIKKMIITIMVIVNLLLAHIVLGIVSVGFSLTDRLNPWTMFFLVAVMLFVLVRYTMLGYRLARSVHLSSIAPALKAPDITDAKV